MSDDDSELERLLGAAFDAKGQTSFPNHQVPPPMRLPDHLSPRRHHHRRRGPARWLAPAAAAAAIVLVAGIAFAVTRDDSSSPAQPPGAAGTSPVTATNSDASSAPTTTAPSSNAASSAGSTSASASKSAKPAIPVHVSSAVISDGSQVGVGMPIIALLSRPIKDARAFSAATTVKVDGKQVQGGWYFERKYGDPQHPIEADWRPPDYWPGHATISMKLNAKGVSAGKGLAFDNNLSLDFSTGAANVVTVDDATGQLTVLSDGQQWPDTATTFPVSLGADNTRTRRGTKVIMEKGKSICMTGPGYHECGVQYTQRLTYDGEYLHAAPWNTYNIAHGIDSSNGCTNLYTEDAKKLYDFLEIGDVVKYPNASGPLMQMGDGYGDWNVPWTQWQGGGLYAVN